MNNKQHRKWLREEIEIALQEILADDNSAKPAITLLGWLISAADFTLDESIEILNKLYGERKNDTKKNLSGGCLS